MKPSECVRGDTDNDFYAENFENICRLLEGGKAVWLYCWCAGHTRCAAVEAVYVRKLRERYGDRLKEGTYSGWLTGYYLE